MAGAVVKALVLSRVPFVFRISACRPPIISFSFSNHVVHSSGKEGPFLWHGCFDSPRNFQAAALKMLNVGKRGFAQVRTRRGGSVSLSKREEAVEVEHEVEEEVWRSRNQSKRDSKRAREWGVELATLAPAQLKQAIRWAGLSEDVYDAVMIVKNLGSSSRVRNGRRRQYNYIGGLLRDVNPDVMEPVLKATKDGDVEGVMADSPVSPDLTDDGEDQGSDEGDDEGSLKVMAENWLQGLVGGVSTVEEEVYSIYDVDYDRQELRKLVRNAQKMTTGESGVPSKFSQEDGVSFEISSTGGNGQREEESLRRFLVNLAKRRVGNEAYC